MCPVDTTPSGLMSLTRGTHHLRPPGMFCPKLFPPLAVPPRDPTMQHVRPPPTLQAACLSSHR